jgi:hypothetical protein
MSMSALVELSCPHWTPAPAGDRGEGAVAALERGDVLFMPGLAYPILPEDAVLFSPTILSSSKNASFDPITGRIGGTTLRTEDLDRLRQLMMRFSELAAALVGRLLPRYGGQISRARCSFRPAEIAGRATSWRKDDTRLHVDSFPASPVQGRRILRVFTNVNPTGRPRSWRIGEDFESLATRFDRALSRPRPGTAAVLQLLRITKTRRSDYDALMLGLHDRMKEDEDYQRSSPQSTVDFPAGSTWLAFTDSVSHAAMAGQYQLEQTFLLPVDAMADQRHAPLRILEKLKGRRLV